MSTFDTAVRCWTNEINAWYDLRATVEEVKKAFSLLKEFREGRDEPGDIPYIETFFKDKDDNWKPLIDTVDREHLADLVEEVRVMASADGAHMFEVE